MQEVDTVIEKYINIINELRRTSSQETYQVFVQLRDSITKRIQELDSFYEQNIHDIRITNFEKVRLRLKKLLMYDLDTLNKIENTAEFSRFSNYNKTENKDSNKIIKPSRFPSEGSTVVANQINNNPNVVNKNSIRGSGILLNDSGVVERKISKVEKPDLSPIKQKDYQQTSNSNFDVLNKTNQELKEANKWKEIVFKIKLTEKEYELLLKEKSKGLYI